MKVDVFLGVGEGVADINIYAYVGKVTTKG